MKKILVAVGVIVLLVILAFLPTMGGSRIDYPCMLMVDGILYVDTFTPVTDVQEGDILDYTKLYTKTEPRRNGQANFEKGTPYVAVGDGLAVKIADQWTLFKKYERKGT